MDKDLLKGLAILLGLVGAVAVIFVIVAASTPDKAQCIADSLKSGVPVANIKRVCRLVETRPGAPGG
ncbi:hypothetical protein [Massilia sp. TS11]|uniref:hypothetical protein n=1 Tax=Massilia sp. TS11 TaxID=2908003 RepID=UPI001EDB64F5|nr:hypothetical protein [Massilia sp. TS11]MCG2583497.1 hypothetical protein [Massilia sp. TS11]